MSPKLSEEETLEADIVVVGAGSAGCIIAAQLSQDPNLKVLVVEAGSNDRNPWIHVPVGFSRLLHDRRTNWRYETVEQPGLGGRKIYWPRGKVVGGSGATNGMIWVRGTPADYERWVAETGDERWSWGSVQKAFEFLESAPRDSDERLGRSGRIALTRPRPLNPLAQAFIEAGESIGLPVRADLSISDRNGIGEYLTTVDRGRRVSSATAFLKPALGRDNLKLLTDSLVLSVEMGNDKVATGVRVRRRGAEFSVRARSGVILSGGAINSPQLLMLSGIGDSQMLSSVGIKAKVHLPAVGANLQDHFGARVVASVNKPMSINDDFRRPWRLAKHGLDYAIRRVGPLTIGGAQAGAFLSTSNTEAPDVQVHFLPLSSRGAGWSFHSFSGVTANVCQLRPYSAGRVTLRSPDPDTPPEIDPNYLSDARDQEILAKGLRMTRNIFQAPPFSTRFDAHEEFPGSNHASDDALVEYARANGSTVFHPVGTCRMGPGKNSVVDNSFAVHNCTNLWVADASIIPAITSGNTNAATMMLAVCASNIIQKKLKHRA